MTAIDVRWRGPEARAKAEAGRGWYAVVARAGIVAKGISYGLVGALAVKLAVGHGGQATSRQGALHQLSQHAFGEIVLILLAAGFIAYALWRFLQAYFERQDEGDGAAKVWGRRAGYVGRGLIYASLAYSTLKLVTGSGTSQTQNEKAHHSTAVVLGWTGGRELVAVAGICLIGAACWNLYRGLARTFEDKWGASRHSPAVRRFGSRAGLVGHVARFVVFGLIGVFVTKAALDYQPKDAIGIDGALQKLAHAAYGPWLLGITAAGLVAYGAYCLVDAALRDLSANA